VKPIEVSAPSNIALIKYMGKTAESGNLPANASLSYTLEHLRSFVTIEPGGRQDEWKPLQGFDELKLSEVGLRKFLSHFALLKNEWKIPGNYVIRSANNFPADAGLASSASSFAALTLAAAALAREVHGEIRSPEDLSRWSRRGSGSSCRSFFTPWALWKSDGAEAIEELDLKLEHAVILVEESRKEVSSSEAHRRVTSSSLFAGRVERAEKRLMELTNSLKAGMWKEACELCWAEFWDMHALFETSRPQFGYMQPGTLAALNKMRSIWSEEGDGPMVTMDAGANVHVLLRPDQTARADKWLHGFKTKTSWAQRA
jgi:diphosphomevalonate decarboxylase